MRNKLHGYLDRTNDVVFKLLFARAYQHDGPQSPQRPGRRALIDFLTSVLRPEAPIRSVSLVNPAISPADVASRHVVLDIVANLEDGTQIGVEMQVRRLPHFRERALLYWARLYAKSSERGQGYEALRRTVLVLVLDYCEMNGDHVPFHYVVQPTCQPMGTVWSDHLELHVLELPRLATISDEERAADPALVSWGQFLKEENDQALEELVMQNPHLADAFAALKDLSADPEARELAWRRVEAEATAEHELAHAKKKARDDGREEGLEEGLQRGLERGLEQGLEKGLEQGLEQGLETATRDAIVTTARAFGVEVTPAREAALQALDLAGLKAFFQTLLQQRAWPG